MMNDLSTIATTEANDTTATTPAPYDAQQCLEAQLGHITSALRSLVDNSSKQVQLKPCQEDILCKGGVKALLSLAREQLQRAKDAVPSESQSNKIFYRQVAQACSCLQLLAYRNQKVVAEMLEDGLVTFVHQVLDAPPAPGLRTAQAGTVFLLAAAIAFCETSHAAVIDSGLVKQLVALCRDSGSSKANIQHSSSTPFALPPQQSQEEPTSPGGSSVDLASSSVLCGTCLLSSTRSLSGSLDEGLGSADLCSAASLSMCAAMALRGLTHNEANHPALLEAGAPEVLMAVMRANGNPPAQRINAAMAVALLVGHEESSAVLMELGEVAGFMLDALRCACMGTQFQGLHWTAWKLLQAFANLAINDTNKVVLVRAGAVDVFALCLLGRHQHMALVVRYALVTLWHLARQQIRARTDVVDYIRALVHAGRHDSVTLEVAKGCLWTLGCMEGLRQLQPRLGAQAVFPQCTTGPCPRRSISMPGNPPIATPAHQGALELMHSTDQQSGSAASDKGGSGMSPPSGGRRLGAATRSFSPSPIQPHSRQAVTNGHHIMISYEWGSQSKALALKMELEARQYSTWLDLDKMSGSTLEAMALAVENAAAVIVCVSKKYKESQACRTEAEYSYCLKKRIIPVMMDHGYVPTGWLGILLGTKLYFDMSDRRQIPSKVSALERELEDIAHLVKHGAQSPVLPAKPFILPTTPVRRRMASPSSNNLALEASGVNRWANQRAVSAPRQNIIASRAQPLSLPTTMTVAPSREHQLPPRLRTRTWRNSLDITHSAPGSGYARSALQQVSSRMQPRPAPAASMAIDSLAAASLPTEADEAAPALVPNACEDNLMTRISESWSSEGPLTPSALSQQPGVTPKEVDENARGVALSATSSMFSSFAPSQLATGVDPDFGPMRVQPTDDYAGHSVDAAESTTSEGLGRPAAHGPQRMVSHRLPDVNEDDTDSEDVSEEDEVHELEAEYVPGRHSMGSLTPSTTVTDFTDWSQLSPDTWQVGHVVRWLHDIQLHEACRAVRKHQIDGRALSGLQRLGKQGQMRQSLKEDLGITRVGLMLSLVDEICKLFGD